LWNRRGLKGAKVIFFAALEKEYVFKYPSCITFSQTTMVSLARYDSIHGDNVTPQLIVIVFTNGKGD